MKALIIAFFGILLFAGCKNQASDTYAGHSVSPELEFKKDSIATKKTAPVALQTMPILASEISKDFTPDFSTSNLPISKKSPNFPTHSYSIKVQSSPQLSYGVDRAFIQGVSDAEGKRGWMLGVGQAGQIISASDSLLGDLIATQTPDDWGLHWVDRVLDANVSYDASQYSYYDLSYPDSTDPTGFLKKILILQQAGSAYSTSLFNRGPLYAPFYSPRIWEKIDLEKKTYTAMYWMQPDLPAANWFLKRPAGVLLFQEIKDLGDQVVEITYVFYNIGDRDVVRLNTPWFVLNMNKLPTTIFSNGAGYYQYEMPQTANSNREVYLDQSPWMAFLDSTGTRGLGVIAGKDLYDKYSSGENLISRPGSFSVTRTDRDFATEAIRNVKLKPGSAMFSRFYLVLDYRANIVSKAAVLSPLAAQGLVNAPAKLKLYPICQTGWQFRACNGTETASFYSLATFSPNTLPLFTFTHAHTGTPYISNDPYAISLNPYEGDTKNMEFQGWVLNGPEPTVSKCFDIARLRDIIPYNFLPNDGKFSERIYVIKGKRAVPGC